MKTILSAVMACVLLAASTFVMAAGSAAVQKIGVVDIQQVLTASPQTKRVADKIKKKFQSREAALKKDQEKLQTNQKKLEKDGSVMSDKQRMALRDKIIADRSAFQGRVAAFQQDISNAQAKGMQDLLDKIKDVISSIANKENYTAIIEMRSVAFVADGNDITQAVVKAMKKKK